MSELTAAIEQICQARKYTEDLLGHIPDEHWFASPPGGVTHVAWQVGHLAVCEYALAMKRIRGVRPEDDELVTAEDFRLFGKGSEPTFDATVYPDVPEVKDLVRRVHQRTLEELSDLDDETAAEPTSEPTHPMFRTKLGALVWCAQHEFLHAGQIGLLRRQLGLESLADRSSSPSPQSDLCNRSSAALIPLGVPAMTHRFRLPAIATLFGLVLTFNTVPLLSADKSASDNGFKVQVWPGMAPGETSNAEGEAQPPRPGENPPVTRVVGIRRPTLDVFLPEKPNGQAILILPGGGFAKVVPDKEGSEAAPWLNDLGIATIVLRYRTNEVTPKVEPAWKRPLQDAQRSLRLIRTNAEKWNIDPAKVGVLGFSAGGQVASILHTAEESAAYDSIDAVDKQSCKPAFSLLIYPWRVYNEAADSLLPEIRITKTTPQAFIVHTHDDRSSSLGAVLIYAGLKKKNIPAELHVYVNGGHGYGMRPVAGSQIGTWPDRATEWLKLQVK